MPAAPTSPDAGSSTTRLVLGDDGPILVEGPVELVLADGRVVISERPVVAVCACRRSERYPFCDTSHRRRVKRSDDQAGTATPLGRTASGSGASSDERLASQAPSS